MLENIDWNSVALWLGVLGIFIMIIVKFKKENNINSLDKEQKKYIKADSGKIEIEQSTKFHFLSLFKFAKKDGGIFSKRGLYIGFIKVGSIIKILNIDKTKKAILVKNSFFQFTDKSKDIFVIDQSEIKNIDNKGIYTINDSIINLYGIFCILNNIKDKNDFLKMIIDKNIIEDWHGRIRNQAGSVIYYNMRFAQEADLANKRIEAEKLRQDNNLSKVI